MRLTRVTPSVFYSTQADYITASLLGTASWAITASYALNGGSGGTGGGGATYYLTSSAAVFPSLDFSSETFVSNGSQSIYTITPSVSDSEDVLVFINGVTQIPTVNYTVSGSTLTFNGTPSSGSNIEIRYITAKIAVTGTTSSLNVEFFTGSGSETIFSRSVYTKVFNDYDVLVSIDGLIQKPTSDYVISDEFVTFTIPPPPNTDIEIRYLSPTNLFLISGSTSGSGTSLETGSTYPITSSWSINSISSSWSNYAVTASYALNGGSGGGGTFVTNSILAQNFVAQGGTSSYSLITTVDKNEDILVMINGIVQNYTSSYSITGSTINFPGNVDSGSKIDIRYIYFYSPLTSSWSINSLTASYALNASTGGGGSGSGFPFSGSAVITGSLVITEDLTVEGNADFGPPLIFTSSVIDWSIKSAFEKMISTNETYTFTGVTTGSTIIVILSNTGSSSVTATFPNEVIWANSLVPTAILPGAVSAYNFFKTNYYLLGSSIENYQ